MVHKDRIRHYAGIIPKNSRYVLYWMQQSQRVHFNHALAFAATRAGEVGLPLVVGFVLIPGYPEATLRHYRFMLEGIAGVQAELDRMGIPFVLEIGEMVDTVVRLAESAAWVVADVGYLRIQREWRVGVEQAIRCPYTEVESDVVVPVVAASGKEEIGARTLRPKLLAKAGEFLGYVDLGRNRGEVFSSPVLPSDPVDPAHLAEKVAGGVGGEASPGIRFRGGCEEARRHLDLFIQTRLADYPLLSRDPVAGCQSNLSPYLHFGHISPVEIISSIERSGAPEDAREAFVEQLLVRRELAVNFVYYNNGYDRYDSAVPAWAKRTLADHVGDRRPYVYSREVLEAGETHDPYWNAAQLEMVHTGKMHNYMRMYWGKKIIEWTREPEAAFQIMLAMNNRYELDGWDPNGFAGVAWCFGRHDRAWKERAIFGKVRYMNAAGLERKFRIGEYVARVGESVGNRI